ncbi:putative Translocase of chloroplast 34 [Nannochloris sp. 'desiccata']|nr:putative Translocase of chloroplast 34 [Chlorella desiccata (nom. nud.)]
MADFDEEIYNEEVDEGSYDEEGDDGYIEEVEVEDSEEDAEEIGAEADDEEGEAGADGGKGQMLYIPGLGYIPLASLGNIPGLNIGGARGGAAAAGAAAPAAPEGQRDWQGLAEMPAVTQETIADLSGALAEDNKGELTILLLGKGGAGKSSTVNSILNERAANVLAFQQDNAKPTVFSRRAPDGFIINVIDTPSLLDQDAVSEGRLEGIAKSLRDRDIDAVLYVDRLDNYAVEDVDQAVINGITRVLGPQVWNNAVVCFTRSSETSAPPGVDFEDHVAAREAQLKAAIAASGASTSDVAVALIENSSRCPTNADGEKVVPGETPWIADLLEKVVDTALNVPPYEYSSEVSAKAADPNRRRKWLIPLILAVQVGVKLLLDRVMDDDGCRGDGNGPFDAQTVQERRDELKEERRRAAKKRSKAAAKPSVAPVAPADAVDDFEDNAAFEDEEEDEDDWE